MKKILSYIIVFICGIVLGGVAIFFVTGEISRQFVSYHTINTASYNFSKNTGLLSQLRSSKIDKAINSLESDLDICIIELHSRLNDKKISADQQIIIRNNLRSAKQSRLYDPYINSNEEIAKKVEVILAKISVK